MSVQFVLPARLVLLAVVPWLVTLAGTATAQPAAVPAQALADTAVAQPAAAPAPTPAGAVAPVTPPPGEPLSEMVALGLSLGGTAASYALIAVSWGRDPSLRGDLQLTPGVTLGLAGVMLAPSFGHWYAGDPDLPWIGARLAAGAAVGLVLNACSHGGDEGSCVLGAVAAEGLALAVVGFSIGDSLAAGQAVRQHNAALRGRSITVTPTVLRGGGGVAVGARFAR